ncbi:hypothetical protein PGTUg99_005369 [Puccinia graminis f. sp. tritici]|uniref:Uncharacterized protein n=1 Tax=Puccinia graminis f. sp. tritici TaxID=56615 RepID=A0A5B0M1A1_PUCGR|nr:hypothetical protein PGTUg99_005369 [Puccinia graminis f. sp. tritici]
MICDALISTRLCRIYLGMWVFCANAAEDLAWYEWGPLNSQDLADRQAPNLDALLHASLTPTLPNSDGAKVVNTLQAHLDEVGRNVLDWGPQLPGIHGTCTTSVQPMLDSALRTWSDPSSELTTNVHGGHPNSAIGNTQFHLNHVPNTGGLSAASTGWLDPIHQAWLAQRPDGPISHNSPLGAGAETAPWLTEMDAGSSHQYSSHGMTAMRSSKQSTNLPYPSFLYSGSHAMVQPSKKMKIDRPLADAHVQSPSVETMSSDPLIAFQNQPGYANKFNLMINSSLGREAFSGNSISTHPMNHQPWNNLLPNEDMMFQGRPPFHFATNMIRPEERGFKRPIDILRFDLPVFLPYDDPADRLLVDSMISFIDAIKTETSQPFISGDQLSRIHEILSDFSGQFIARKRKEATTKIRKPASARPDPQTQKIPHIHNSSRKWRQKNMQNLSVNRLMSKRHLWYKFWNKRTGIDLQDDAADMSVQVTFKRDLTILLFYVDMIGILFQKPQLDSDIHKDINHTLLHQALGIAYADAPKKGACKSKPNEICNVNSNLNRKKKSYQVKLIWYWIEKLILSSNNPFLQLIFFPNQDGKIEKNTKVFFNNLFHYSIENLNQRLEKYKYLYN